MIKYYCDICQKELSSYEYDEEAIIVSLLSKSDSDALCIRKLCPKCETELIKFLKGAKINE